MFKDERKLFPMITFPTKTEAPENFIETFLTRVPDQPDYSSIP